MAEDVKYFASVFFLPSLPPSPLSSPPLSRPPIPFSTSQFTHPPPHPLSRLILSYIPFNLIYRRTLCKEYHHTPSFVHCAQSGLTCVYPSLPTHSHTRTPSSLCCLLFPENLTGIGFFFLLLLLLWYYSTTTTTTSRNRWTSPFTLIKDVRRWPCRRVQGSCLEGLQGGDVCNQLFPSRKSLSSASCCCIYWKCVCVLCKKKKESRVWVAPPFSGGGEIVGSIGRGKKHVLFPRVMNSVGTLRCWSTAPPTD